VNDLPHSLRRRARAHLDGQAGPAAKEPLRSADLREALAELEVHQVELELQNEELLSAQRRLEDSRAALAASENHYRALFQQAPVGYLRVDATGTILEANRALAALLGENERRLAGRKLSDFILSSHQDAYYLHRQAVARGEHPAPAHVTLRALDGQRREVELEARRLESDAAELLVVIIDVTARERAEAERHEAERQRRSMADSLPVAVGYVGADGRCELCNRAFEDLYGSSARAVEGRPVFEVLGPEVYTALREGIREALSGKSARFEGQLLFPGTGHRFVSALLAPDALPDGRLRGFYVLIDDRTDLEDARRGLREAAVQVALAEQRERRALASDLHDGVGQLLSLASIKLRELQEQASETVRARQLRKLAELTRLARESIASLSFELSPPLLYDVGFVAAAEWLADSLQQRYGLRTKIARRGEEPDLDEATRVTLFRALRELLINVARHAGTKRAWVAIENGPETVSVAVEDRGAGFDPHGWTGGFGLGSVVERIESLGGRVAIDAAPERGVKVRLTLPAAFRPTR
jgi:PAS domain S-box-containing protein